jgi:hypothetical protein
VTFVSGLPRWLKAAVGLVLLTALILNLDWSRLYNGMQMLRWPLIGVAALLYPIALLVGCIASTRSFLSLYLSAPDRLHRFFFPKQSPAIRHWRELYRVYWTSVSGATSRAISAVLLEGVIGVRAPAQRLGRCVPARRVGFAHAAVSDGVPGRPVSGHSLGAARCSWSRQDRVGNCFYSVLQPAVANVNSRATRDSIRRIPAW